MLDIIIPTYNNKEGLKRTLASINFLPEITVTVVDDCSKSNNYDDLLKQFNFNICYNNYNCGPGMTRQRGIRTTIQPYILFIDTGDYFISQENLVNVINIIQQYSDVYWLEYQHLNNGVPSQPDHARLHGRIFKRSFLEQFNIHFNKEGSRANEDVGFTRMCRLALKQLELTEQNTHKKYIETPLIVWDKTDKNSITQRDNHAFSYISQNIGLAANEEQVINWAWRQHIHSDFIFEEICEIMLALYYHFLCTAVERPEYANYAWEGAQTFYKNVFSKEKFSSLMIQKIQSTILIKIRKKFTNWDFPFSINIKRFLSELETNQNLPEYYLTKIEK